MSLLNYAEIPGYAEACKKEQEIRDLAFCEWLVPLCGIQVKQFTYLHLLILANCENAFVEANRPQAEDVAFFLWVVSPDYRPNDTAARDEFIEAIAEKVKFLPACQEIYDYLNNAFQDSPASSGGSAKSYTSFVAPICDLFAHEYGWDDQVTIKKPIARLYQLIRRIQKRNNPQAIMFNRSDAQISKWLASLNGGNN
jgi:hypothetical protein